MEDKNNVLVLINLEDEHKKLFESAAPSAVFTYCSHDDATPEMFQEAEVIIGNPPVELIKGSKKLKWVQLQSAGADQYVNAGGLPEGTVLTNATGAYGLAISEYMLGVLLELIKKLHLYRDNQRQNHWKDEGEIRSVYNSTILIVGLGDIGSEFAKRTKALGAYTIGVRRADTSKPDYIDELSLMDKLDTLLPRADVVALSLPNTSETRHLFTADRIAKIKKGAILINVGRGSAIDTDALCDALQSGHLSGAALDVTDPEPLPADHILWSIESAVITPHVSGGYHLKETFERIVRISAENLRRYSSGERLKNVVDFSTGYRAHLKEQP
jgi:phosphoglycerate dehydrogenase-like enzyme